METSNELASLISKKKEEFHIFTVEIKGAQSNFLKDGSFLTIRVSDPDPDPVFKFSGSGPGSGFSQDSGKLQKGL